MLFVDLFLGVFFNSGIVQTLNNNNIASIELICIIVLVTFVEFHVCIHVCVHACACIHLMLYLHINYIKKLYANEFVFLSFCFSICLNTDSFELSVYVAS